MTLPKPPMARASKPQTIRRKVSFRVGGKTFFYALNFVDKSTLNARSTQLGLPDEVPGRHLDFLFTPTSLVVLVADESMPVHTRARHVWRAEMTYAAFGAIIERHTQAIQRAVEAAAVFLPAQDLARYQVLLGSPQFEPLQIDLVAAARHRGVAIDTEESFSRVAIVSGKECLKALDAVIGIPLYRRPDRRVVAPALLLASRSNGALALPAAAVPKLMLATAGAASELAGLLPDDVRISRDEILRLGRQTAESIFWHPQRLYEGGLIIYNNRTRRFETPRGRAGRGARR